MINKLEKIFNAILIFFWLVAMPVLIIMSIIKLLGAR